MASPTTTPRRDKNEVSSAVDNKGELMVPLDFSFFQMSDLIEISNEDPRPSPNRKQTRNADGKFDTKCIKLNNNLLQDISKLVTALQSNVVDYTVITWIDLSMNELPTISEALCEFPNLQILYLHGNYVRNIEEVDKLGGCANLKKLSLHGNPIMNEFKGYRWYVLSKVQQLISFDMSPITRTDRANTAGWVRNNPPKKKRKRID